MSEPKKQRLNEIVATHDFNVKCRESVNEVFESLFMLKASESPLDSEKINTEISAVVAFMNDDVEAIMQLTCSKQTIVKSVTNQYEDSFSETQSVFFLGEAVNIIFGMLKENLNLYGLYYDKCLPIVISGQDHLVLNLNNAEILNQTFKTDFGVYNLKIGLNKKNVFSKAG